MSFMAFPSKLQARSLCSLTCGPEGMHHKNSGREQSSNTAQTQLVISSELPHAVMFIKYALSPGNQIRLSLRDASIYSNAPRIPPGRAGDPIFPELKFHKRSVMQTLRASSHESNGNNMKLKRRLQVIQTLRACSHEFTLWSMGPCFLRARPYFRARLYCGLCI